MSAPPRQLPLDLAHRPGNSRDDLVVGQSNMQAVSVIDRWPDWPSRVLVLAGPAGAGKSHLAAVWQETSGAVRLAPGALGAQAIEQAALGPVLIDDLDAGPVAETGLFHVINAVRSAETSLLITARRFPLAWGVRLPDLVSRLKAVATIEIDEPVIARRIERSLSTAIEVVARLDRVALEQKTRISRTLAANVVAALDAGQESLDV
jgi:chromosomal replication initiation ATPase DnaA